MCLFTCPILCLICILFTTIISSKCYILVPIKFTTIKIDNNLYCVLQIMYNLSFVSFVSLSMEYMKARKKNLIVERKYAVLVIFAQYVTISLPKLLSNIYHNLRHLHIPHQSRNYRDKTQWSITASGSMPFPPSLSSLCIYS